MSHYGRRSCNKTALALALALTSCRLTSTRTIKPIPRPTLPKQVSLTRVSLDGAQNGVRMGVDVHISAGFCFLWYWGVLAGVN